MARKLITTPPDGLDIGANSTDKIGFYGNQPVPQRSNPCQALVKGAAMGQVINYMANGGVLANAVTITCNELTITATGLLATDFVLNVMKPTAQAGMGIAGVHANANDTLGINLINPTAANVVPTANQQYVATVIRGLNVVSANLSPASVVTKTTSEQEFSIGGSGAVGVASLNASGGVSKVVLSNGGAGYYVPPAVVFTPARGVFDAPCDMGGTGTANALPANVGGSGATGMAIVSNGQVVGVQITDPGSGYTAAPTVSFVGGQVIAPGMVVQVNKTAFQAGLGIGNVRVSGVNKIAITFVNPTAANITPTANETYKIFAFNQMGAVGQIVKFNINVANFAATGANGNVTAAAASQITAVGALASDIMLSVVPGTAVTGANAGLFFPGVAAANALAYQYMSSNAGAAWTPANNTINIALLRPTMPQPSMVHSVYLTPTAVAANTTAEQVFTLPANVTLMANSGVLINKPSHTSGIGIVGARANASNEVAITFINNTGAAITPPAEMYLMANFPTIIPTLHANLAEGHCSHPASQDYNRLLDLTNEQTQALVALGVIKGS